MSVLPCVQVSSAGSTSTDLFKPYKTSSDIKISCRILSLTCKSIDKSDTKALSCPNGRNYWLSKLSNIPFGNYPIYIREKQAALDMQKSIREEESLTQNERFEDLYEDKEPLELLLLDPAKWKDQDHYAVLGLRKMRYRATDEEVKKAYRRKVLKHHPDKTKDKSKRSENFFKCVQKAYEFLSDPVRRRQYDSVDPVFDESLPSEAEIKKHGFFSSLGPVFARNAHFSKKHPVPSMGDDDTPREKVEAFYKFWTEFESWRTFELLDEDVPNEFDSRDERRWIEKQNRAKRAKLLKEDRARLYKLVDLAISTDPRIRRFKEQDKQAKMEKKLAKRREQKESEEAAQRAEEEKRREEERRERERQEEEAKMKRERQERKNEIKKLRREIRQKISDFDYFKNEFSLSEDEVEKDLIQILNHLGEQVDDVKQLIEALSRGRESGAKKFKELLKHAKTKEQQEEEEKKKNDEERKQQQLKPKEKVVQEWSDEEVKLLIKAVNMFPGGTGKRWEKIAEYIQQHHSTPVEMRETQDIIQKSKEVRSISFVAKAATLQTFEKKTLVSDVENNNTQEKVAVKTVNKPWSAEEQSQLEAALKKYPSSGPNAYTGADRWDKIAAMVEGRTRKEVLMRVKEIIAKMKK